MINSFVEKAEILGACAIRWYVEFRENDRVNMQVKEKKHFWKRRREGFSRSWVTSEGREENEKTRVR